MLQTIDPMVIMLADLQPFSVSLDTLYILCLGSGIAGRGINHLTYARYFGGVSSKPNISGMTLFGSLNTT